MAETMRLVTGPLREPREIRWIRLRCVVLKGIVRRAEKERSAVVTTVLTVAVARVAAVPEVIAVEVLVEEAEEVSGGAVADARKSVGRFWQR